MSPASARVYFNGRFMAAEKARISISDRAFLYGDGLFETIPFTRGRILFWDEHMARFSKGLEVLGLRCPQSLEILRNAAGRLARESGSEHGLIRLQLSAGPGPRGYSREGADKPTVLIHAFTLQPNLFDRLKAWRLAIASERLPVGSALSAFKHGNKLVQVLAKNEAIENGADEPLLLNTNGHVAETGAGNIFWIKSGTVFTPPVSAGILPGITREVVMRLCKNLRIPARTALAPRRTIKSADGVFVTFSSLGIVEASHLDGRALRRSEITEKLWQAYRRLIVEEQNV